MHEDHQSRETELVERALVAAMFRDPSGEVKSSLKEQLHPFYFRDSELRGLYTLIVGLSGYVDEVSVADAMGPLTLEHWGGLRGLYELADTVPTSARWKEHLVLILKRNKSFAFQQAVKLMDIDLDDGHDPEHALKNLDVIKPPETNGHLSLEEASALAAKQFLAVDDGSFSSLSTPFHQLNHILGGGFTPGLTIIAARPSVGKTAFALALAAHWAKSMTVGFLSLEMSAQQLAARLIQSIFSLCKPTGPDFYVPAHKQKLREAPAKLEPLHLEIFDDLHHLEPAINKIKHLRPRVAFIDYLQLLENPAAKNENRAAQVSGISRALKLLSLDLDVPIIALAQLNREAEKNGRPPRLSDLRESGSIEQDADQVMFLSRVDDDCEEDEEQDIKLSVAKNRSGATGHCKLTFKRAYQTWHNPHKKQDDEKPF